MTTLLVYTLYSKQVTTIAITLVAISATNTIVTAALEDNKFSWWINNLEEKVNNTIGNMEGMIERMM